MKMLENELSACLEPIVSMCVCVMAVAGIYDVGPSPDVLH